MIKNIFILLLCIGTSASCQSPEITTTIDTTNPTGETYDPPNSTDTRSKPISFQQRKTFRIGDIYVSNEFYGARLTNIYRSSRDRNTLIATITPENEPINKSAWYAFRIWSDTKQEITIQLHYQDGRHRYLPKLSLDGENWKPIQRHKYKHHVRKETADLKINIGPKPLWVSAQELMTSRQVFQWIDSLQSLPHVYGDTAGYSTLNKPIRVLKIAETKQKNVIIVFSRQHPPEVTGQFAAQAFIEAVLDSSDLAKDFRSKFQVYAFPLINPDGTDQGHWRHNAGGVDLNRDWWKFRQPEVKHVTDYLKKHLLKDDVRVWYGLDFHSTNEDILYPISNEIIPDETSITRLWIDNMNLRLPSNNWVEEPYDISSPIAKNWIFRTFGAEAITYEIGDESPRDYVRLKSKVAAEEMMRILLIRASH